MTRSYLSKRKSTKRKSTKRKSSPKRKSPASKRKSPTSKRKSSPKRKSPASKRKSPTSKRKYHMNPLTMMQGFFQKGEKNTISVNIEIGHQRHQIKIPRNATIAELYRRLRQIQGITGNEMLITMNGSEVDRNDRRLSDYNIIDNCTLTVSPYLFRVYIQNMAGESTPIDIFSHNSNVDDLKRIYAETHPDTPVRRQRLFTYDENAVPVVQTILANGTPLSQYGLVNDQTIYIFVEDRYIGERLFDIHKNNIISMCVFENELFVTSLDSFIQVYDTNNGNTLRRIGEGTLTRAAHIYISPDGHELYVTDRINLGAGRLRSTIKVFSRYGDMIRELNNIGNEGMFVHNNELFIPDETRFFVISSIDGSFSRSIDIGFNFSSSCFSPINQEIFVTNIDNGVVHVYDIHGNQLRIICHQPPQINAGNISISPEGNELFLCCDDAANANVVKVFNTNGQYLHLAMQAGDEITAHNVVVNHNTVFVQSYRNPYISAFSR